MELGDSHVRAGGKTAGPEGDRNSAGRLTESTNLDPWGFQRPIHQPKNIHGLDVGFPVLMQQMGSLVFMWVLNNWSGSFPSSYCLYVGYVLLSGLPCLASVEEVAPSLSRLKVAGLGDT